MDLSTTYVGLRLRSPLVASAGPHTSRVESLRALEDAGVAAVVLPSLFEEQVVHDELSTTQLFDVGDGSNPEATSYFPDLSRFETVADRYVRHVEDARRALSIPVIASLNGVSPGGWARYSRLLQDAGADALELNFYHVPAALNIPAAQIEAERLELVRTVDGVLMIPLAVKVSPHYSAFANFAARLVDAGADAIVMFNRLYQPDVSPDTRVVTPLLELSTPAELRQPLRWIGLLYGRIRADLAASTGIHSGIDAAKALLVGATVTMMTSALLRNGPDHIRVVEQELVAWAREHDYESIGQVRGSASQQHVADPAAFERANHIAVLVNYSNTFASAQGHGPW
jgi:dihydroorotate dehydrogenase (fumarate)